MTINYPIAEIDTKPVPIKWKSRPKEEIEKEAEERSVKLYQVESFVTDEEPIKTSLTWVSHGNYSISQPKLNYKYNPDNIELSYTYIEIEEEYFDQIIEAYESKDRSENIFEPFWKANVPPRGMLPIPTQLKAYFYGQKNGFVLQSQRYNIFFGYPSEDIDQLGFTIEDFKKIKEIAISAKDKPVHYCKVSW